VWRQWSEIIRYSAFGYERQTMKACGGSGGKNLQILYPSTLDWCDLSASHPVRFTYGERAHSNDWICGYVGPRATVVCWRRGKSSYCADNWTTVPLLSDHSLVINWANQASKGRQSVKLYVEVVGFIRGCGTTRFATVYKTWCSSVHLRAHVHIVHSSDLHGGVTLLAVFVLQSQK